MGYYSEVVIAIESDTFEQAAILNTKFPRELFKLKGNTLFDDAEKEIDNYLFTFNGKWYEGYPEIEAVMRFLETLDEEQYGFLRVGEEPGDTEEHGLPYDFGFYTQTRIERY